MNHENYTSVENMVISAIIFFFEFACNGMKWYVLCASSVFAADSCFHYFKLTFLTKYNLESFHVNEPASA